MWRILVWKSKIRLFHESQIHLVTATSKSKQFSLEIMHFNYSQLHKPQRPYYTLNEGAVFTSQVHSKPWLKHLKTFSCLWPYFPECAQSRLKIFSLAWWLMTCISFTHFWALRGCVWEGNGNLLQYSCLENPMDGGAW